MRVLLDPSRIEGVNLSRNPIPKKFKKLRQKLQKWINAIRWLWWWNRKYGVSNIDRVTFYNINLTVSVLYSEVAPKMRRLISVSDSFNNKEVIHFESQLIILEM